MLAFYFCNLINNLPPIVITESTTPKIIKPRKEKHADIVFTKGEIKFANMIINSILQYAGVKSFKVLVTISDRSKIKSYRTIATILFMKKYPETPRIHLFILFEKLKIKESFRIKTLLKSVRNFNWQHPMKAQNPSEP